LFFLGGGKALINAYYGAAQSLGIDVAYDTEAIDFDIRDGRFVSATVTQQGMRREIRAKALVAASGGFEANFEWLHEAWGPPADNFIVRGTPYNVGTVLKRLLQKGARSIGDPTQGHCVAIDARSPKYDGGIVTRVDAVSFGIVVNRNGSRFYDEGEDFWPKRYAIWGRLIAAQPDQIAFALIDAKAMGRFMPPLYPPIESDSIAGLAKKLGLDPPALVKTVVDFNAAVRSGTFDHRILDDCATENLEPSKSHWARALDKPPITRIPCGPESRSPISASRSTTRRA
jgi:tricarballylate dehydrogenase